MRNGIIYMYTSPSGKKYIGQTWREQARKKEHKQGRGGATKFYLAIQKYGISSFSYQVLKSGLDNQADMDFFESFYIAEYDSIANGYNLSSGGDRPVRSPEVNARISRSKKGYKHPEEILLKIANSRRGYRTSESTKMKLSLANKRRRKIAQYSLDGEFISFYDTITEAAKAVSGRTAGISLTASNKCKYAFGFVWKYAE